MAFAKKEEERYEKQIEELQAQVNGAANDDQKYNVDFTALLKKNEAMQMDNKRKDVKINENANRMMATQAQLGATSAKLKQLQLQY